MAKESQRQRKTTGRVMHDYEHGELKRGRKGGKVKSRRPAIAIALHEAGASKYESKDENRREFPRTKSKERRGSRNAKAKATLARAGGAWGTGCTKWKSLSTGWGQDDDFTFALKGTDKT